MIDVNTFIGTYPYRALLHTGPDALLAELDRGEIETAWVGHLPSAFHRDPTEGNRQLYESLKEHAERLKPVPAIRPDWPGWQAALDQARGEGAVALRAYPPQWRRSTDDEGMRELALACGAIGLPLILTVRFEDLRQRHALDIAGELPAATIRFLARAGSQVRLIVCAAGRDTIEEVHWGLTPAEQKRLYWDFSWIWGPPEHHLAKLFDRIGPDRFVYGSQWPLRLSQTPRANLDLLPEELADVALADPAKLFDAA